jgi:hypothetical protein
MSRSNEGPSCWTGGASIFSGRRDPAWAIDRGTARRLEAIWHGLRPCPEGSLPGPVLGYRGCSLRDGADREWFAYGGVVTLKGPDGSESRRDEAREFETALLVSAPGGVLPASFLDTGERPRGADSP